MSLDPDFDPDFDPDIDPDIDFDPDPDLAGDAPLSLIRVSPEVAAPHRVAGRGPRATSRFRATRHAPRFPPKAVRKTGPPGGNPSRRACVGVL